MKPANKILMLVVVLSTLVPVSYGEKIDGIAAIVNKKVITDSQLETAKQQILAQGGFSVGEDEKARREKVINFLVEKELVRQRAEDSGILVTSDELDAALADIAQRNNFLSDDQLKTAVKQEGRVWDDFLEDIRGQIKVAKLINREVRSKVQVSDDEIRSYYDEHADDFVQAPETAHIRQILLKVKQDAAEPEVQAVKAQALTILEELRSGADFATLAAQFSEHPSAKSGGELGTFKRGELAAPFDIAFTMNAGEISEPVRSEQGFHLIYVEEKTGGEQASYEKAAGLIQRKLSEERSNALYKEWVDELRARAFVEIK